jgi:HD-GYP domain-containing protein (c-di-GMP phosphodiesterase class II)
MSSDTQRRTRIYVAALGGSALLVLAILLALGYELVNPWTVLALAVVNALAERGGVWITRTTQMSIALLPTLFAAVLFGPLAGGVVNAASMLGDSELLSPRDADRAPRLKWATYTSTRFIIGAAAGLVAQAIIGATSSDFGGFLIATLVAAVVAESLDVLSAGVTARIRGRSVSDVARTLGPLLMTSIPAYAPVVAILALAYTEVSPWTAPLFFIPALAAQRLFAMYQRERDLAATLSRANLSFAVALVTALEASDAYTAGHSRAVAIYSRDIARRMGMSEELYEKAFLCGLVHDIGKVGLPPSLLGKDGPLTLEERKLMQTHSEIGERILLQVDAYGDIASIVRHHHERIDGEGYPDRISGDDIPQLSRIIAVADAYNAMTSNRPYREAMPSRVARLRLAQAVETQFDTSAVAAFEAILAASDEAYRTATRDDFSPIPVDDVESEPHVVIQPVSNVA